MSLLLAGLLLAVELGGGFGTAAASVVSTDEQSLVVDFRVEVSTEVDSVLLHLGLPGEDPITVPMLPRGEGVYGITTEVRPADYLVIFEAVGEVGVTSPPVSLSDLGVDLAPVPAEAAAGGGEDGSSAWMWLAVAFAAASLSALAFWVLGGGEKEQGPPSGQEGESVEPAAAP